MNTRTKVVPVLLYVLGFVGAPGVHWRFPGKDPCGFPSSSLASVKGRTMISLAPSRSQSWDHHGGSRQITLQRTSRVLVVTRLRQLFKLIGGFEILKDALLHLGGGVGHLFGGYRSWSTRHP